MQDVVSRGTDGVRSQFRSLGGYRYVVVAIVVYAFYLLLWASPRYAPEVQVYVKSSGPASVQSAVGLPSLISGMPAGGSDIMLLKEYLHSRDLLNALDGELGLIAHYQDTAWDMFSRLPFFASDEDTLDYFRDHVAVDYDMETGVLEMRAQAYTPEFALALTVALLQNGEDFINTVGHDIARQEIGFVTQELERARASLDSVRTRQRVFLAAHQTLSPEGESQAFQTVITGLQGDIIRLRADEKALSSYLNDGAAELVSLRARLTALEQQLALEQEKLADNSKNALSGINADYQALLLDLQFATDIYQASITSLEQARLDAIRKLKHLVVVQSPALPDEPSHPRTLYWLLTVFVVGSLFYGVFVMIIATVKEHRDA